MARIRASLRRIVCVLASLAGLCALSFLPTPATSLVTSAARAQTPAPAARREKRSLAGLKAPGQIIVDHWGVSHLYGADAHDAFFLQGYNVARDRLWQIDLWRKRGLGRLSASFGPAFVDQDRASRLFLYRGDMAAEWSAYAPESKSWTEAFVAGVNAYIHEIDQGERPLPPEFSLTASRPELWDAEDVVRIRSHALVSNLVAEAARARSLCLGGLKYEALRRQLQPSHRVTPPPGLDPCVVTPDVLRTYVLATAGVTLAGKVVVMDNPKTTQVGQLQTADVEEGSNNWVVSPTRSATGRPILANDPHRRHAVPSLRYLVHLDAPNLHMIGAGEPALPGVSFGHNDDAAWGLTIFPADQEDLYVYRLSKDHPDAYFYGGRWEKMKVAIEPLPVKGEPDRQVVLRFTRHGPVIDLDVNNDRAFAVRSVWSEPGTSGYFNSTWMFRAKNWADFETAHRKWGAPALNLVYADTKGDIGWLPSAKIPIRPNWDGLTPVPGDGRYEWSGFLNPGLLPSARNPKKGWFATANEMNLPAGYPDEAYKVGFEWTDRSRIDRIEAVLGGLGKISLVDSELLQTDVHSTLATRFVKLLSGLTSDDGDQTAALKLLAGWDGVETVDSAPAALFEVWTAHHLSAEAVTTLVPERARPAFSEPQLAAIAAVFEAAGRTGAAAKQRDGVLKRSLGAAFRETSGRLGNDPARWRWGNLHRALFAPASAALADPATSEQMSVGPLQMGGSASTPMATTYQPSDFSVIAGASVRLVMDVGAWDNSVAINTPGQSGDPSSAHYRDLFPIWAAGSYVPLLYSRDAVLKNAETVIDLVPRS